MKKLIIFGTGKIAEAVSYFFNRGSGYEICTYACDREFIDKDTFLGKPVADLQDVCERYPSAEYSAFVAVGYQFMNKLRTDKVEWFKSHGYSLASYVSRSAPDDLKIGANSIVMDDAVVQPCVTLGDNTFVWGGALVGHHAVIKDNCWITGSCAVGGLAVVGNNCFLGLNATVGNEIVIGDNCLIGASASVFKSLPADSVLVEAETPVYRLNTRQFIRLSGCFKG